MKSFKHLLALPAFGALCLASNVQAGTTYVFTVTCPHAAQVVEWGVGDIDPGKEFLRVSTGTKFPDCSVSDYRDSDANLPRTRYSHENAIFQGIPLIGPILESIFGQRTDSTTNFIARIV